jgi:hypothetical protein
VVASVAIEAAVVGVLAAGVGMVIGIELARFLLWLLGEHGFRVPDVGIVVLPRTMVVATIVGIVVTVVAALIPAVRAARTPPVGAPENDAYPPASRADRQPYEPNLRRLLPQLAARARLTSAGEECSRGGRRPALWSSLAAVVSSLFGGGP